MRLFCLQIASSAIATVGAKGLFAAQAAEAAVIAAAAALFPSLAPSPAIQRGLCLAWRRSLDVLAERAR